MNGESLSVTNIGKVRNELEVVHNLATSLATSLDTKRKHTTESSRQVLLRKLVALVALKTRIADPSDVWVLLQPSCELERVLSVSLTAQTERLNTEEKLLGREWIHR